MHDHPALDGVEMTGAMRPGYETILTPAALAFVAQLHRMYDPTRRSLLAARVQEQAWWNAGNAIDFPAETLSVRLDPTWRVRPAPTLHG